MERPETASKRTLRFFVVSNKSIVKINTQSTYLKREQK
jgi:hypothetical protein